MEPKAKDWNPKLYLKFEKERTQPSIDLLSRIDLDSPKKIIDLGCGPGNSTRLLADRWPAASVEALDSSPGMLEKAAKALPDLRFIHADLGTWVSEAKYNLIFSNATLQWISNHHELLPRVFNLLEDEGVLAIQVPFHYSGPLNRSIIETSLDEHWKSRMGAARDALSVETESAYYDILSALTEDVSMWTTEYFHVMESPQAIVDWVNSTALRPFLAQLQDESEVADFKAILLGKYERAYAKQADSKVLLPFKRLFMLVRRV
ncbi:MAG: methyltransferase domain-containing protein [Verrucomicrobiota bacterium]